MPTLRFDGHAVECDDGETVLDALLRHGLDVPSSCRNGHCQSCMLMCKSGDPGTQAQKELKESLRAQGYFLACQCAPAGDMWISSGELDGLFVEMRVVDRQLLAPRIAQLQLEPVESFDYRAGQFVQLRRSDGLVRSYSLASEPSAGPLLELHVTRQQGGRMSTWLHELEVGACVDVRGPAGSCFYVSGREDQPLLLVGTGTGLAPLLGVARAANAAGHRGDIHLYHGSVARDGLYFVDEMKRMAEDFDNLYYHPCVDAGAEPGVRESRADLAALADHRSLAGWRVFLCGHPGMVKSMKTASYLAGASLADILSDPFEMAG